MTIEDLLSRMALALGIGLLVGLERGWVAREARPGSRTAGVRTFAISGLLGGITAAMARGPDGALNTGGGLLLGSAFLGYAGAVTLFTRAENQATQTYSATTTIAALLTFMMGAYALIGDVRIAAASAVAAAGILVIREELHGWLSKMTLTELQSGLVLLAMTFIALPIMPDRAVGPYGGVNLREVWLIAIALAAVSFVGYLAVKWLGERRGVLLAAAMGGLVSSTAVALSSARRAATGEGAPHVLAAGTALATAVSFMRVLAIVVVLAPPMVSRVAPALALATAVAVGYALVSVYRRSASDPKQAEVKFRNPFGFWSVLALAASVGLLMVVGRWIHAWLGVAGAVGGAAAMGLFDVDAMAVSMARLVPEPLLPQGATVAILTGVATNTLVKIAMAAAIGRGTFAREMATVGVACLVTGALVGWATLELVAP